MACEDLNLPDLSESDPGKPIKASWGDRVVEAIQANCETITGFGKANSWFQRFAGDGSDGDLDVAAPQNLAIPAQGVQFEDLTIRAGVTLTLIPGAPNPIGRFKIGVTGTLTMEAGALIQASGQGLPGQPGGAGGVWNYYLFPGTSVNGSGGAWGFSTQALSISTAGAGGGGGGSTVGFGGVGAPGGQGGNSVGIPRSGGGGGGGFGASGGNGGGGIYGGYWLRGPWAADKGILGPAPGGAGGGGGGGYSSWAGANGGFGGAGGNGGPLLVIEARKINIVPDAATIAANGTGGGGGGSGLGIYAGGGGGGGGGAGGNVALCYQDIEPLSGFPVIQVNGGPGAGGGPPAPFGVAFGGTGGAGVTGNAVIVQV